MWWTQSATCTLWTPIICSRNKMTGKWPLLGLQSWSIPRSCFESLSSADHVQAIAVRVHYQQTCIHPWLIIYLFGVSSKWNSSYTYTYMYTCTYTIYITYIYLYIPIHMQWHTYIHKYITYINTLKINTLHKYIHTYMHTYIHKYIRTYIHTYLHTLHYITLH